MVERLIPKARPDDDALGADKRPSEGSEGKEQIKHIQPKAQDAEEVEKLGLMKVPRRFTFRDAKKAITEGISVIARSEHPDEATGECGVNPSKTFDKEEPLRGGTLSDFKLRMLLTDYLMRQNHRFCEINGIDIATHNESLSWSFWEKIPGVNLSVVEDNARLGRYWVMGSWKFEEEAPSGEERLRTAFDVFMVENEKLLSRSEKWPALPESLSLQMGNIIESYEKIKSHFGSQTAWVVEMQLSPTGELYFLQRHPTRSYERATWSFDSEPDPDEIVVRASAGTIVRGTTPKEGIEIDMVYDGYGYVPEMPQQAGYTRRNVQNPVMFQKWVGKAQLFLEILGTDAGQAADPHSAIIPLTKSKIYVCVPDFDEKMGSRWTQKYKEVRNETSKRRKIFRDSLNKERATGSLSEEAYYDKVGVYSNNPENLVRLKVHIRSDGTEARIKILDIH